MERLNLSKSGTPFEMTPARREAIRTMLQKQSPFGWRYHLTNLLIWCEDVTYTVGEGINTLRRKIGD